MFVIALVIRFYSPSPHPEVSTLLQSLTLQCLAHTVSTDHITTSTSAVSNKTLKQGFCGRQFLWSTISTPCSSTLSNPEYMSAFEEHLLHEYLWIGIGNKLLSCISNYSVSPTRCGGGYSHSKLPVPVLFSTPTRRFASYLSRESRIRRLLTVTDARLPSTSFA